MQRGFGIPFLVLREVENLCGRSAIVVLHLWLQGGNERGELQDTYQRDMDQWLLQRNSCLLLAVNQKDHKNYVAIAISTVLVISHLNMEICVGSQGRVDADA